MILGATTVQNGILKVGTVSAITNLQTDLVVNSTDPGSQWLDSLLLIPRAAVASPLRAV